MKPMAHQDVQKMMGDIYNGFYLKWAKNPPSKNPNDPGWGLMVREVNDILERYGEFSVHYRADNKDAVWNPAAEIAMTFIRIIEDRVRGLAECPSDAR